MHVGYKYVNEIQDLGCHGNLLNGNNSFGTRAQHIVSTPVLQMQEHNMFSIILSLFSNCKQIKQENYSFSRFFFLIVFSSLYTFGSEYCFQKLLS